MNWNPYLTKAIVSGIIGITSGIITVNIAGKQRKKSCKIKEKSETTNTVQENENTTTVNNDEFSSSHFKDTSIVYDNETGELFIGKKISNEDLANFLSIFQDPSTNNKENVSSSDDSTSKTNTSSINKEHPTNQQ